MSPTDTRPPDLNGFVDPVTTLMSEEPSAGPPQPRTDQHLRELASTRRLAERVLAVHGSYGPGLAAMREELDTPDTTAAAKERMEALQTRHGEDMRRLADHHAQAYLADALDAYLSKDDGFQAAEIDQWYAAARARPPAADAHAEHRYAHLRTFVPLLVHRAELAVQDRARAAQFPASVAEFRALREREARVRVARFLALPVDDKQARERTMAEFGWVYRQVRPLEEEYARDTAFRAEIHAVNASREATSSVVDASSRDPRRKMS